MRYKTYEAQKHVGHEAREAREHVRHKVREAGEHVKHKARSALERLGNIIQQNPFDQWIPSVLCH